MALAAEELVTEPHRRLMPNAAHGVDLHRQPPRGSVGAMPWMGATEQFARARIGELSLEELRDGGLDRCRGVDAQVGFLVGDLFDDAPAGVPMLLKDAGQEITGTAHWAGLASLRDAGHRSTRTTHLVERFERAGFSIIGKSSCPPLAGGVTTEPPGFVPTRNPWDPTRSVGGSSGGAAAAVACGAVPVAHGSDATGSLRFPAALCGLVTLVPTAGLVEGVAPCGQPSNRVWRDFVVARDARDLAVVFDALAVSASAAAVPGPLRVGLLDHDPELGLTVDPACARAVRVIGEHLEQRGHHVSDGWPDALGTLWQRAGTALAVVADASRPPVLRWVQDRLGRPLRAGDVPDDTIEAVARDQARSNADRTAAHAVIDSCTTPILRWWNDHDLLVTPATFRAGWDLGGQPGLAECGTLAAPFSLTGQPSLVVPTASDGHAPVGAQIVGRPGSDASLLHLAHELQDHLGWLDRRPSIFVD
jgi:amidase